MSQLVDMISLDKLRTTLSPLRGERTSCNEHHLGPLPIRVAATADGTYEVLDGFKRLASWNLEGRREVPVVTELVSGAAMMKARLLQSNMPRKTASPMDEARVVASLADDDQFSVAAIGKLLGRKKPWVSRRLTLARHLAPEIAVRLDRGHLSLTCALALCAFGKGEQRHLADAAERHALTSREAEAFLATYRAVSEPATREALLRDPRSAQPKPVDQGGSPLGSTAVEWEARFDAAERVLEELQHADFSGLSETEQRVLDARRRRLAAFVLSLAHQFQKEQSHESRGTEGNPESVPARNVDPRDREETRPQHQNDSPSSQSVPAASQTTEQAGAVQGSGKGTGSEGSLCAADSARNPRTGLHRIDHDPERLLAPGPRPAKNESSPGSAVRNENLRRKPVRLESVSRADRGS